MPSASTTAPGTLLLELEKLIANRLLHAKALALAGEQKEAERYWSVLNDPEPLRRLAGLVEDAAWNAADAAETVTWLIVKLDERRRHQWLEHVDWASRIGASAAPRLLEKLTLLDARAAKLKLSVVSQLLAEFNNRRSRRQALGTSEELAARFAVDSGAFDYGGRPDKAKKAFSKSAK